MNLGNVTRSFTPHSTSPRGGEEFLQESVLYKDFVSLRSTDKSPRPQWFKVEAGYESRLTGGTPFAS